MNSSKNKKNCGAFFFKLLGTFLGMNKGSADGNPQPLIEYVQKNHQIMQFDTENHMKKLLTCGILHYMIDVKELAYEILVHFRYLHCRVINERVQDRKNYSEISALLQIERGSNGYSMFFSLLLHPRLRVWHLSSPLHYIELLLRGAEIRNSTHDIYLVKVKVSKKKS